MRRDRYRQRYHLSPPYGFMNDPNGVSFYKGVYHVFYQWNTNFPGEKQIHWGHFSSDDMINWNHGKAVLAPVDWYDKNGCYSGSAIKYNDKLYAFYTGNVKDENNIRSAYQCLAISSDGFEFEKYDQNPLIDGTPKGYTPHYRDPKVWLDENGNGFMVIGAQRENHTGTVVLYTSTNMLDWEFKGEISDKKLGYMWECPDLFKLDGYDVLIFCPQGLEPEGDLYNNRYQCGYMIGNMNLENGKFDSGDFVELDRGFEFYAPQTVSLPDGRIILYAWMGMPEEEDHPSVEDNWVHCMTMPRELDISRGMLIQKPVGEIERLKENKVESDPMEIREGHIKIPEFAGESVNIKMLLKNKGAKEFGVYLKASDDLQENTMIKVNSDTNKIELNREKSGLWGSGIRRAQLKSADSVELDIYLDTSSVEVFVNGGEEVFTARIFPSKEGICFGLFANGGAVEMAKGEKSDMKKSINF